MDAQAKLSNDKLCLMRGLNSSQKKYTNINTFVINGSVMCVSDPCSPQELSGHLGRGRLSEEDKADREAGHALQRQSDGDGMPAKNTP